MHPAMQQLAQLPIAERLSLVQQLWDSIDDSHSEMSTQDWHRELVSARLSDLDEQQLETLSREQVWQEVQRQRGS